MKKFSNTYIFIYITVMVAAVAVLLSVVSVALQPRQQANRDVEKMRQILDAAGYENLPDDDVIGLYNKVSEEWVVDAGGNTTSRYMNGKYQQGKQRAFTMKASDKEAKGLPVFVIKNQGDTAFVVPVHGKGLWGPIWGYIGVADDGNTLMGTSFSHKSETPGLGAGITETPFRSQFRGKTIFDRQGKFVSVNVVKGGVAHSHADPAHAVDALSGATITSRGVDLMLRDCLQDYVPFFKQYFN